MSSVPKNALQKVQKQQQLETLRPNYFQRVETRCVVVKVYDVTKEDLPDDVVSLVLQRPGYVYAQVKLLDGSVYNLPFLHSVEELYTLYGSISQLVGRPAKIQHPAMDPASGRIVITAHPFLRLQNDNDMSSVFDIGALL